MTRRTRQEYLIPSRALPDGALATTAKGLAALRRWFKDGFLRRTFLNAGVLLSGKTLAGLFALAYLALTARALGPETFGVLVLIHTYVEVASGITKFQSWQAVIRYGAACLQREARGDFQGLIKFSTSLDLGAALLGAAGAAAVAPLIGPFLGWSEDVVPMAMVYSVLILFTLTATPTGVLRLFDRFDLLAGQAAVTPGLRLVGAGIAYLGGAGLWGFLLVWLTSGIVGRLVLLGMGWWELHRRGLTSGMSLSLGGLTKPHPGIWRFVWATNLHTSLGLVGKPVATLAVGWILGPAGAGLFRIAQEFSGVLAKPVGLLKQTIYPELAKLAAQDGLRRLGRLVLRSGLIAGAGATVVLLAFLLFGREVLRLTVGDAYLDAYGVLLLLVLAEAIAVFGFALFPAMYAIGRPGIPLQVGAVTTFVYFALLLFLLTKMDLIGAGLAGLAGSLLTFLAMTAITLRLLARRAGSAA